MQIETIGIIAGGGQFPFLVAQGAHRRGLKVVAVGFSDHTDMELAKETDDFIELHIGQLNKLIRFFKRHGVSRIVLAGAINKPRALHFKPDLRAMKLLFKLRSKGDDAILTTVAKELESEGLQVASALTIVPDIGTPAGVITRGKPNAQEWADLRYGWPKAKAIGSMDIGQSLVVKNGMVVAVEGPEGTDATLRRSGELAGPGCVLVKVYKPGQDNRMDLPAAGLQTVQTMIETGASCLGIEAGNSLFFDAEEAIALADKHGIHIVGLTAEEMEQE
ncbi:LpxI family protein [Desulfobaculum bizertense]|uniref:UDP-2,3-diacylglucosamine pyrophosphatase LpxI n=1 Tax=Desulfobaculum bizertense DSM 18034 TaxID=1121442 RepID=A0A1T4WEI4_9BACT|nr:UDP-2,3-diacylglucosamine diphosphatase LpxI [Desulfobaculum bizertense]UIJ36707.1 UDP-2,3-diacylglucosamine diphosphatase LpxI [Desulfobaculum bizertense]SKA75713.1 hypothetical protein SAMN02745702_02120 [Desulfobaculum bizertense DSM 18034]